MKNYWFSGLLIVLTSLSVNTAIAARPCDDKQVYLAVMESARNDLPKPFSEMTVKGSLGIKSLSDGQCRMTLFLVGDGRQTETNVLYNTNVPLPDIHVKLESEEQNTKALSNKASKNKCMPIKFQKGHISGTVTGSVGSNSEICYNIATGADQTMEVKVISTNQNTVVTIPDVGDARDTFKFVTKKKTYELDVFQMKDSPETDQYSLTVTVR
jgi:hypothetical protein